MKLETTIPPRKDGTVSAEFTGCNYRFRADEHGRLVADIDNEGHIAFLLATDMFFPADEKDFELATAIANTAETKDFENEVDIDGAYGEEENPDAVPVEALTPPSRRRARKVMSGD